jgi:hypothetical protein
VLVRENCCRWRHYWEQQPWPWQPSRAASLTAIFVGAYWPVIGMGVVLEVGKLSAVAWLGHYNGASRIDLKGAITLLILVLMGLNVVGAYGFLAKAPIGHRGEGEAAIGGRMAEVGGRISVQEGVLASLDRQIAQIDKAVDTATQRGRTSGAMQLAPDQRCNWAELVASETRPQTYSPEADLAPSDTSRHCSVPGDQDVLRWSILVVAALLDPAAVLLLLAATRR